MVVLKELNLNYIHFGRVWWSLKELNFNSFSFQKSLGGCGGLERS